MYFDAVLDNNFRPVFNGTPENTRAWLMENLFSMHLFYVCIGSTLRVVSVSEYLAQKF